MRFRHGAVARFYPVAWAQLLRDTWQDPAPAFCGRAAFVYFPFTRKCGGTAIKCPAGALTVGTAVGGIWEAHDLGEQNFYDMEDWPAIWGRYAVHVRASMAEGQAGGGGPHGVICMVDGL